MFRIKTRGGSIKHVDKTTRSFLSFLAFSFHLDHLQSLTAILAGLIIFLFILLTSSLLLSFLVNSFFYFRYLSRDACVLMRDL